MIIVTLVDRYLLGLSERANRRITEASSSGWLPWLGFGGVSGIVNVYDWAGRGGFALTDARRHLWDRNRYFISHLDLLFFSGWLMSVISHFIGAFIAGMVPATPPLKAITSAWSDNPYFQM